MLRKIAFPLFFMFPVIAYGQVYKCVLDGRTIYQDEPCLHGGMERFEKGSLSSYQYRPTDSNELVTPANANVSSVRNERESKGKSEYRSQVEQRNAEVKAHAKGYLVKGMSENQAITILGHPDNYKSQRLIDGCKNYYWNDPPFSPGYHQARVCNKEVVKYYGPKH